MSLNGAHHVRRVISLFAFLAASCGPESQGDECYSNNEVPNLQDLPAIRVCGVDLAQIPSSSRYQETYPIFVTLPLDDGVCPICSADVDPLLWAKFLDMVSTMGLAEDEDPSCVDDGYEVMIACRDLVTPAGDPVPDDECRLSAVLATNCTLGGGGGTP